MKMETIYIKIIKIIVLIIIIKINLRISKFFRNFF